MDTSDVTSKQCTRKDACVNPLGSWLPATAEHFRFAKHGRNNQQTVCRECERADAREYQRTKRTDPIYTEQMRIYLRDYNQRPERQLHDYHRRRTPEYRQANRIRCSGYWRRNGVRLTENYKSHKRKYRNSPEGKRALKANKLSRRAREVSLLAEFTAHDWSVALAYFGDCCAYCGNPQGLWNPITADHFIPITSPECVGTVKGNIVPACKSCNSSKNNRDPRQWLETKYSKRIASKILKRIRSYFQQVCDAR